jgi:hypothetical protein
MKVYRRLLRAEGAAALRSNSPADSRVAEADVSSLPETVQRYLRFMGVAGRPRDWSFRARFEGRFRLRPGQRWMPMHAWQYNSAAEVARIFVMRISWAGIVPMVGIDTYLRGKGRMSGKLLNVVPVADGRGPEFDVGELTTWLNDAILVAPSMLLGPATSWSDVDHDCFEVTLRDAGLSVSARVWLDERGAPCDFSSTDRYAALPGGPVQARWTTPIAGWDIAGERPLPIGGSAVWHLAEGPFSYAEGRFVSGTVEYNVAPGNSDSG